ncbi:hypothetical protein AY605_04005 [Acinetobacter sp. SFD]|nr:hypothetical protein [Acinetobacter sp. SFD]OAL84820.1 hypothetical protein AY605_04005 [Acinetobacter sp. SFD]
MIEICTKKAKTQYSYHKRSKYEKSYIVKSLALQLQLFLMADELIRRVVTKKLRLAKAIATEADNLKNELTPTPIFYHSIKFL